MLCFLVIKLIHMCFKPYNL
uniref:Uncharacterized protein n=1 Tax=Rhizophora mucronata TaxID=61149 RepID=A0A2P2QQJ7_RHIMU